MYWYTIWQEARRIVSILYGPWRGPGRYISGYLFLQMLPQSCHLHSVYSLASRLYVLISESHVLPPLSDCGSDTSGSFQGQTFNSYVQHEWQTNVACWKQILSDKAIFEDESMYLFQNNKNDIRMILVNKRFPHFIFDYKHIPYQ